jgi:hypothetical protein
LFDNAILMSLDRHYGGTTTMMCIRIIVADGTIKNSVSRGAPQQADAEKFHYKLQCGGYGIAQARYLSLRGRANPLPE